MGKNESPDEYVLATGDPAADRLALLNDIFGPDTRELLIKSGLAKGMKAADIGCGTGLVALWMASQVGASGSVAAVDASADQLRVAEKNAMDAGVMNISFHQASAYRVDLPREEFDMVYSRFLMCHLAEPDKALSQMRALLKADGILACEDHDDGGIFSEPMTPAYKRLLEISAAVNHVRGLDSRIGLKLPQLIRRAGFKRPEVMVKQASELRGVRKRFWEVTLREAAPAIIAAGVTTQEELESVCAEIGALANDENTLVMIARVTQVWARK